MQCLVIAFCLGLSIFAIRAYQNDAKEGEYYRENGGQTTATVTKAAAILKR